MIRSRISVIVALAVLALLSDGERAAAQSTPATAQRARQLRLVLHEMIDTKDFQVPLTIKEALQLLQDKLNARYKEEDVLPILVDEEAFRGEEPGAQELFGDPFKLGSLPRRLPVATLLRIILNKAPGRNATFLVRQGVLEVTTVKVASPKRLLQQTVLADFANRPLRELFEDLSERTGLSVILDGRVGDKAKTSITATLGNDVTLEGALHLFADMAGLQLVVTDTAVYITTPGNAQSLTGVRRGAELQATRQ